MFWGRYLYNLKYDMYCTLRFNDAVYKVTGIVELHEHAIWNTSS